MTIFGWDMSHYDAPGIGNAVAQGISFITHKAGGDATDTELDNWWREVRNLPADVVLGAYWVLYPGSPEARADRFLARLDSANPGWRERDAFILQVDCEKWGGNSATVPSIREINVFCDRLVARTGGKYQPIVYAPKWVYGDVSGLRYPVWASSYVSGPPGGFKGMYPGDDSNRWRSYGKPVSILQYTSSATIGGQTTCDANAFRGSVFALKRLVTPGASMAQQLSAEDIQAIASKISVDLNNPDSGVSKGLRKNVNLVIDTPRAYAGSPGDRIEGRGWGEVSVWTLLEYLFEMVAADVNTLPDNTIVSESVPARLERIEAAVTEPEPEDDSATQPTQP